MARLKVSADYREESGLGMVDVMYEESTKDRSCIGEMKNMKWRTLPLKPTSPLRLLQEPIHEMKYYHSHSTEEKSQQRLARQSEAPSRQGYIRNHHPSPI